MKTPGCFDGVRYRFLELLKDKQDEKVNIYNCIYVSIYLAIHI